MSKPSAPERPEVSPAGPSSLRIGWTIPDSDPEVTACTVKVRIRGSQRVQNYDHETGRLVLKGGASVPTPTCEVQLEGVEEGLEYEAMVAAMNSEGWGDLSESSVPACIGAVKPRGKPPAPAPPKLTTLGTGKMRCQWTLPEACPPVEASQVQITEVDSGVVLMVDAANGKLLPSGGRTSFAASRLEVSISGCKDGIEYVAAINCRNAEGFGPYSLPSEPVALVDKSKEPAACFALVLHNGPSAEVPFIEPIGDGKMKVKWTLPEDAKSTMVKIRRVGDKNWRLCGGTAIQAPATEIEATGCEEGLEYEAVVSYLIGGKWCSESQVSKPACIGDIKLPDKPSAPKEPRIFVVDHNKCILRIKWSLFTAVPPLMGAIVKFRAVGARTWQWVHPTTGQLLAEEPQELIPVPRTEVDVPGVQPGIRYEATVAFKNKLGRGPDSTASEWACVGRPLPKPLECVNCFKDFDLQHSEYTKDINCFMCPTCRFRHMDPFHAVVEPYGMLFCHIVLRPTVTFNLELPDLKTWRKEDHSIHMRMVKIDSEACVQVWPHKLAFEANGNEVFVIKEPEEGHVRRDVPKEVTPGLKPGMNHIVVKMDDEYLPGYAFALVRTQQRSVQAISADVPICDEDIAQARIMTLLADTWETPLDQEDDEEITCVVSNKLKLRCPLSFERVITPVRGETCRHLQCFGLRAYLETNVQMKNINNRWTCPVCANLLKPEDLRIDGYVKKVLEETEPHIEEVLIMQDGTYRPVEDTEPEKAAAAAERARKEAEEARAEAEAKEREGEVTEMPTTIDDADPKGSRRRRPAAVAFQEPALTRRQRRRQRALQVQDQDDDDEDNRVMIVTPAVSEPVTIEAEPSGDQPDVPMEAAPAPEPAKDSGMASEQ